MPTGREATRSGTLVQQAGEHRSPSHSPSGRDGDLIVENLCGLWYTDTTGHELLDQKAGQDRRHALDTSSPRWIDPSMTVHRFARMQALSELFDCGAVQINMKHPCGPVPQRRPPDVVESVERWTRTRLP